MPARFSAQDIPIYRCSCCGQVLPFDDRCTCSEAVEAAELRRAEILADATAEMLLTATPVESFWALPSWLQDLLVRSGMVQYTPSTGYGRLKTVPTVAVFSPGKPGMQPGVYLPGQ